MQIEQKHLRLHVLTPYDATSLGACFNPTRCQNGQNKYQPEGACFNPSQLASRQQNRSEPKHLRVYVLTCRDAASMGACFNPM